MFSTVIKRYLATFGESLLKQYTVSANKLKKKLLYAYYVLLKSGPIEVISYHFL